MSGAATKTRTSAGRLVRVAVVGGGLAGLSAALELVDAGHEVVLHEARPTLGGAVQTLPEREGDPPPPPDNGQHIALGCFHAYRRFVARIGKDGALRREPLRAPGDRRARPRLDDRAGPAPARLPPSATLVEAPDRARDTSVTGTVP